MSLGSAQRQESPTIRVQSILYNLPFANVERSLEYLDNAAKHAILSGTVFQVSVVYGDCSSASLQKEFDSLAGRYSYLTNVRYNFFAENKGSAAGHNKLLGDATEDYIMILNPDVLLAPNIFGEILGALCRREVGLVEARQLPIEHPKHYDESTGETSWASTACATASRKLFQELGGFDDESFFLYCDDVDFSWRVRLAGYKVVYQPSATVFHDKRVSSDGAWLSGQAERYYSAEAGLMLPYKYSREDLTDSYLDAFVRSDDQELIRAAAAFELRKKSGRLPCPIDPNHTVAQFVEGAYAPHRYRAR